MTKYEKYNRSEKGRARYERYRRANGGANERRRKVLFTAKRRAARLNEIKELLT